MRRRPHASDGDLLGGTLDMLILRMLQAGSAHGFAIARRIAERSRDVLLVEEGTLYPALHRLERRGWIRAAWGVSEHNRRAKFYTLTTSGRAHLSSERDRWRALAAAVTRVMEPAS